MTKEIVSVSLSPSVRDYTFTTELFGEEVHVQRLGTDGDVKRARELVAKFDGQVDAIGLGGMNIYFRVGHRTYIHKQIQKIASAAQTTPVVDGVHIRNTLERWAIGQIAKQQPGIFSHRRVFVVSGIVVDGFRNITPRNERSVTGGSPDYFSQPRSLVSMNSQVAG